MPLPELDHTTSGNELDIDPHVAPEEEHWPIAPRRVSDGKKHRCHVCRLHVIPGLPPDAILGGQLTADGRWEHFRCNNNKFGPGLLRTKRRAYSAQRTR